MFNRCFIFGIIIQKFRCQADDTGLIHQVGITECPRTQHIQRQKGDTSGTSFFEKSDSCRSIFSRFRDDILNGTAERDLNRQLKLRIGADKFCDDTTNPFKPLGFDLSDFHDCPDTGIVTFVSRLQFFQRLQPRDIHAERVLESANFRLQFPQSPLVFLELLFGPLLCRINTNRIRLQLLVTSFRRGIGHFRRFQFSLQSLSAFDNSIKIICRILEFTVER